MAKKDGKKGKDDGAAKKAAASPLPHHPEAERAREAVDELVRRGLVPAKKAQDAVQALFERTVATAQSVIGLPATKDDVHALREEIAALRARIEAAPPAAAPEAAAKAPARRTTRPRAAAKPAAARATRATRSASRAAGEATEAKPATTRRRRTTPPAAEGDA
jgi:hypothetical protein